MLNQHIAGSFLGAVCGSCLGSPHVYMKSQKLMEISHQIGWTLSPPGGDMALCFASVGAIGKYGVAFDKIARAYCRISAASPDDIDLAATLCFCPRPQSPDDIRRRAASHGLGTLCSNAVLTRQLPIVYAGIRWDCETLDQAVAADAALTHDDPRVAMCAQTYARALWAILNGKTMLQTWDFLMENAQDEIIREAIVSSYFNHPQCDGSDATDITISLSLALWHYWRDTPFVTAVRSAILAGGSTDVNAAAVGAIIGAAHGTYVIPASWRRDLQIEAGENESWKNRARASLKTLEKFDSNRNDIGASALFRHVMTLRARRLNESRRRQARISRPNAPLQTQNDG